MTTPVEVRVGPPVGAVDQLVAHHEVRRRDVRPSDPQAHGPKMRVTPSSFRPDVRPEVDPVGRDDVARTVAGEERDVVVAEPAHEDGPRRGPNGVSRRCSETSSRKSVNPEPPKTPITSWRLGRRRSWRRTSRSWTTTPSTTSRTRRTSPSSSRVAVGLLVRLRSVAAGGAAVGLVEATALEGDADAPEHLAEVAAADGAFGQRSVAEGLHDLEFVVAVLAAVFVGRHGEPRRARVVLALQGRECQPTSGPDEKAFVGRRPIGSTRQTRWAPPPL